MREREEPIATVALAEVVGGRPADCRDLRRTATPRLQVCPGDVRWGSVPDICSVPPRPADSAAHAFVITVADVAGGAVVASVDCRNMERLAAHSEAVVVASIVG